MADDKKHNRIRHFGDKDQKKEPQPTDPFTADQNELFEIEHTTPRQISLDELEALVEANKDLITPIEEPWVDSPPPTQSTRPPKPVETPPTERFPPVPTQTITIQTKSTSQSKSPQLPPKVRRRWVGNWRHDLMAFIFFLATLGLIWYFSIIWRNPFSPLNPLAKPTPFIKVSVTPDRRAVANYFATQTAEAHRLVDSTPIPQNSIFPFIVLENSVIYAPNANGSGCDWASIAGTVTDLESRPLNNYRINIIDAEDPTSLDVNVFSGSALTFGNGGFELPLSGSPGNHKYEIQLLSPSGAPVSKPFIISTRNKCDENVVIINFQQVRPL